MAVLSHRTFIEISNTVHENFAGRKIIACMIMKKNDSDQSDGVVVAMGTGNRCITGERMSMEGKVVNDSHAEIVCRRAFISFLYIELEKYASTHQQSIFECNDSSKPMTASPTGQHRKTKLRLKNGISFHLYISTAPCGDSAIFTPRDTKGEREGGNLQFPREHCPTFTSKVNGVTRSKIENGEGTIPIEKDVAEQSFDGILRGQRLRTMSCSDKICRWNVVGMQGALLNRIIEPVYLESLTLGYLYDHGHLSRAVCCRLLKNVDSAASSITSGACGGLEQRFSKNLPNGFRLNHPWIGRVTQYEVGRETEKTNNVSMNWSLHEAHAEVTDGRTGAQMSRTGGIPTPSRLCKFEMLKRFKCLVRNLQGFSPQLLLINSDGEEKTYRELKDEAVDFQRAKKCFVDTLSEMKYGPWVTKPREQDMFC